MLFISYLCPPQHNTNVMKCLCIILWQVDDITIYIIYNKKHPRKLLIIRSLLLSINILTCCSLQVGGCAAHKVFHAEHTVQTSGKPFADLSLAFMQPHLLATSLVSFPNYPTDLSGSWNYEQTGSTMFP